MFRISADVVAQELDGETVLLDLASEQYFGLDAVSTRVWGLLGDGVPPPAIVDTLLTEFDVSRTVLERDVADLLDRLQKAGLIRRG